MKSAAKTDLAWRHPSKSPPCQFGTCPASQLDEPAGVKLEYFDPPLITRSLANLLLHEDGGQRAEKKPGKSLPALFDHRPGLIGELVGRSEEHTSELQSLMRISYAVFCLKKKNNILHNTKPHTDKQPIYRTRRSA